MSHFGKNIIKLGLVALALWGGYNWINQSPAHKNAVSTKTVSIVQASEDRANAALKSTNAFMGKTKDAAASRLKPLNINNRVDALQSQAKPLRRSIQKSTRPVTAPVAKAAAQVDKKFPLIGIIFMLISGVMVAVMAASMLNNRDYA